MATFPLHSPAKLSFKKRFSAFILSLAIPIIRVASGLFSKSEVHTHKIIILEPFGMGDAISLVPLVEGLLEQGRNVVVCAKPAWRRLFPENVTWVDAKLPWVSYDDTRKYRIFSFLHREVRTCFWNLRKASRGGVGVDTRGDIRSILFLWLAGCRKVFSISRYLGCNVNVPAWCANCLPYDDKARRWQMNLEFLKAVGSDVKVVSQNGSQLWNNLKARLRTKEAANEKDQPEADGPVGFVPISPWAGKEWPRENWLKLAKSLHDKGETLLILCGPGQEKQAMEATANAGNIKVCNSVNEWAVQLQSCKAVVTVDTGPMHLADVLNVPLVALFGLGSLPLWAPSSPGSIVLHRMHDADYVSMHPTGEAIEMGQKLMARHRVEDVWQALDQLIGK